MVSEEAFFGKEKNELRQGETTRVDAIHPAGL